MQCEPETDLATQLSRLNTQIDSGEGDLVAALEDRESVKRRMEAERIKTAKVADAAYLATVAAKSAEFRARAIPSAEQFADLYPRLLWASEDYAELERESMRGGGGNVDLSAETGIPFGFAQQLRDVMVHLSSGLEFHYDFLDDPAKKNPLPHARQMTVDLRGIRQTDIHGRPLDGGNTYIGGNP